MRCGDKLKQYRLAVINCVVALCVCSALLAGFSIKPAVSAEGLKCPAVEVPRNTRMTPARRQQLQVKWRRAIDQDNLEDLWQLLAIVDAKDTNEKGKTALMAAVKVGDFCLLQELQQLGLSVQQRSSTGGTALMYAVLGNELKMIEHLLPLTDDINAQSTNGWTAVMIAAAKGFDEAIVRLVDAGADANIADVYQWSPLMRAIDNKHTAVVSALLGLPVAVNHVNENGSTALHIAVIAEDIDTVKQLLKLSLIHI